jgi:hypothetical protein
MSTEEYPLSLRFEGPGLQTDGMPIGELGEALIAAQRLVYKAYLVSTRKDVVHTVLSDMERQRYALQIATREHGSEFVLLNWLSSTVQDAAVQGLIKDMLVLLGGAAVSYLRGDLKSRLKRLNEKPNSRARGVDELAVRMYPEIQELVSHIGTALPGEKTTVVKKRGGVKHIPTPRISSLSISIAGANQPIVFDEKVKNYVRNIENATVYGETKKIYGMIDKALIRQGNCIEALFGEKRFWVKVRIREDEPQETQGSTKRKKSRKDKIFRRVLRHLSQPDSSNKFRFVGRPIYRFGRSAGWFNEFEAENIVPIK